MTTENQETTNNPLPNLVKEHDNNHLLELYNRLVAEVSLRINEGKSKTIILSEVQTMFPEIDKTDLVDHVERMIEESVWQVRSYGEEDFERSSNGFSESSQTQLLRGSVWLSFTIAITLLLMYPQSKWGLVAHDLFGNQWSIPVLAIAFVWGVVNLGVGFLRLLKPPQPK